MKSIYVMDTGFGLVKLGISKDPERRRRAIASAAGLQLQIAHVTEAVDNARSIEAAAHKILKAKQKSGEWFGVTIDEAITAIADAVTLVEARERRRQARRGRPYLYSKRLVRLQVMAPVEWADEAARMVEAGKARSVSEVYRLWMERGRTLAQASG